MNISFIIIKGVRDDKTLLIKSGEIKIEIVRFKSKGPGRMTRGYHEITYFSDK